MLIVIGYYVRRRVEESPVFEEIAARKGQSSAPISQLFRRHTPLVIVAALIFAGSNAVGYMTTGGTTAVTVYLGVMTLVGLGATLLIRDRSGIPLGPDSEELQAASPLRISRRG